MQLVCVDPKQVHSIWPFVRHMIFAAMYRSDVSAFVPVQSSVLAEIGLLWLVIDNARIVAAAVTELQSTEQRRICTITACAGWRMREWLPLLAGIEKFARDEDCAAVRIVGRKGWARVLKDYCATRVILEKDVG